MRKFIIVGDREGSQLFENVMADDAKKQPLHHISLVKGGNENDTGSLLFHAQSEFHMSGPPVDGLEHQFGLDIKVIRSTGRRIPRHTCLVLNVGTFKEMFVSSINGDIGGWMPLNPDFNILSQKFPGIAGGILKTRVHPLVFGLRQKPGAVFQIYVENSEWMKLEAYTRRTDIRAGEGSKETGCGKFKPSRPKETIERMALVPIRIFCTTGIIVHGQYSW